MQIEISVRHGQLKAQTQETISEKVSKLTRLWDRISAIYVTVDMEHEENPWVEVRVTVAHSPDLVASDRATTVVSALDSVIHKLEQQLRKHKDKRTGRRGAGLKGFEPPAPSEETE